VLVVQPLTLGREIRQHRFAHAIVIGLHRLAPAQTRGTHEVCHAQKRQEARRLGGLDARGVHHHFARHRRAGHRDHLHQLARRRLEIEHARPQRLVEPRGQPIR
jgi:hypothetical protein